MNKKCGNWKKMCNFVGMKKTLPEIIKQDEKLRRTLLSQEGGIMRYLAEHLDADGTAALFTDYQNHCVNIFFEKNKWDMHVVWEGDDMRRAALGEMEHLWRELSYQRTLTSQLTGMPEEVIERVIDFTEQYLKYAYKQNRQRRHPEGMTPKDIYQELIGAYSTMGHAYKCMEIILREHNADGDCEKSESELFSEFLTRQYSDLLTLGTLSQLRQAVAEMLEGKSDEQCRQMAIDTLKQVRGFSQKIYTDAVVEHFRDGGYTAMADQREREGEWLRDVAQNAVFEEYSANVKTHSMRFYFADFVNLLKDVGRIWAAQLLVRGIDMKVLEKGVCCILKPSDEPHYYVDSFYFDDLPGRYCVANDEMAKKLLSNMYGVEPPEDFIDSDDDDAHDEIGESNEQHGENYLGKDYQIFHENLNVDVIADAVKTLPRGEVIRPRKFFKTVYTAFNTLHWLTCTETTKFISWMKYHSGIHFETKHFKNVDFDTDMRILLSKIIEVFADESPDGKFIDKDKFYRKNPQGHYLNKINKE